MEEKFYVKIKDDYGVVREFEVPTLEMKEAIDNIDKDLKEGYKQDAMNYARPFSAYPSEDYISYKADQFDDSKLISYFETQREILKKAIWKVVKNMKDEKYKKILYMRFKGKLKFNKIAQILSCSKQSISDNYKTAIDDLRVLLCEDKDFQSTYFFKHWKKFLKVETNLVGKEILNDFAQTKNLSSITIIDNIITFMDDVKIVQKKKRNLDLLRKHNNHSKNKNSHFLEKNIQLKICLILLASF